MVLTAQPRCGEEGLPSYYGHKVPFIACADAHPQLSCVGKALFDAQVIGRYGLGLNLPFHALSTLFPLFLAAYRRRRLPSPRYAPLHLDFQLRQYIHLHSVFMIRDWLKAIKKTAHNTMWSTLFFCSFGFCFSALYCLLRNLRKARHHPLPPLRHNRSQPLATHHRKTTTGLPSCRGC